MSSYSSYSSSEEHSELIHGLVIDNSFEIYQIIGEGGYGQIYEVVQLSNSKHYAMKVEYFTSHNKGLRNEARVMKDVQVSCEFPEFIASGETEDFRYLVMEILGPSLSQLCKMMPTMTLSRYTLLHLGIHMISCLRSMHDIGYIHRDVKPGNFLIRPLRSHPMCIIDFGLARKYVDKHGEHKDPRKHPGYTGTYRFASIHAHEEYELSRRDDLISWFYSMVELADGSLPWPASDSKKITVKIKKEIKPEELCRVLTPEFIDIYKMIMSLNYNEEPDYDGIINILKRAIENQKFTSHKYDWEMFSGEQLAKYSSIKLMMDRPASSENVEIIVDNEGKNTGGCCLII